MKIKHLLFLVVVVLMVSCSSFRHYDNAFQYYLLGDFNNANQEFNQIEGVPDRGNSKYYFIYRFLDESLEKFYEAEDIYPKCVSSDSLKNAVKSVEEVKKFFFHASKEHPDLKRHLSNNYFDSIKLFFQHRIKECDSIRNTEIEDSLKLFYAELYEQGKSRKLKALDAVSDGVEKRIESVIHNGGLANVNLALVESYQVGDSLIINFKICIGSSKSFESGRYKERDIDAVLSGSFDSLNTIIASYVYYIDFYGVADSVKPEGLKYETLVNNERFIKYSNVLDRNKELKNVQIQIGGNINNFMIAFLRAYNASNLFEEITERKTNGQIVAIDFEGERGKEGRMYRSAGYSLVIADFFKEDIGKIPIRYRKKIEKIRTYRVLNPDGDDKVYNLNDFPSLFDE